MCIYIYIEISNSHLVLIKKMHISTPQALVQKDNDKKELNPPINSGN